MEFIGIVILIVIGLGLPLLIWAIWIIPFVGAKSLPSLHGGRMLRDYIQAERLCRQMQITPWFVNAFRVSIALAIVIFILAARFR